MNKFRSYDIHYVSKKDLTTPNDPLSKLGTMFHKPRIHDVCKSAVGAAYIVCVARIEASLIHSTPLSRVTK